MKAMTKRIIAAFAIGIVSSSTALAAPASDFTQVISAGTLSTDILDASRVTVAAPSIALSAKTFNFDCQFGANSSTGGFGTNTQRIYAINPNAATPNGWTITMAATAGPTASWANTGATKKFDFNDPTTSGCTDGADTDTLAGQMTVDPSTGTLVTDCVSCTLTGVTKGSSTGFVETTTNSVTLFQASAAASNPWRGYLTGATIKQTIPAEQPVDSTYSINMTLTSTAL